MSSEPEPKWGWSWEGDESAEGPYDSREDALEDARDQLEKGETKKLVLGVIRHADPGDCVDDDLDSHLERMDEAARDNDFAFADDNIFEVPESRAMAAKAALHDVLAAWA